MRPRDLVFGGLILLGFLLLAVSSARTKEPWEDESWFATATYNLANKGTLSNDILEGAGTWREGMKCHFYWQPPLSFVVDAAAVKLFGFSLFTVRSVSLFFGVVAILCAFMLARKLTVSDEAALLAMALVSFDYFFLIGSSDGRMDAMCMALGLGGIAAYIALRENSLWAAILISQGCVVASGLTHPNGIIWFVGLWLLTLGFDRARLRPTLLVLAAVPYVVGAVGWGSFIAQDPKDFKTQFLGNIRESGSSNQEFQHPLEHPITAIGDEVTERYIHPFGLAPGAAPANRLKGMVLAIYAGAVVIAIGSRKVRCSMAGRVLLCVIAVSFILMTYVAGNKMSYYLIHMTPLLAILTAVVLASVMSRGAWFRWAALCVAVSLIALQAAGVLYRIRQNTYRTQYLPAVSAIREHSKSGDLVMGSSAFFWTLRGERRIVDDFRLGYYSHVQPDLIVIGPFYRVLEAPAQGDFRGFLERALSSYHRVPFQGEYEILSRDRIP